jgi:hypothetical protein
MTDKRKLLDLAFNGGDKKAIKSLTGGFDEIEMERMLKANPETLSNEQLEKCLDYLCKANGRVRIDYSTWTNEQLEARLFELNNKLIKREANR